MPEYIVYVHELHISHYQVTAKDPDEARKKASNGQYNDVSDMELVELLGDPSNWNVEEQE